MSGMPAFNGRSERATVEAATGAWAYLRPGVAVVNVNVTTTGALAVGDPLFALPAECRPASTDAPIFGTLVRVSDNAAVRVDVQANGQVQVQVALTSGTTVRGSFTVPL